MAVLLLAALLHLEVGGGYVFRYVDKRGQLHFTDTLAEVPEPYHSLYQAKLRELEEKGEKPGAAPAPPDARPPRPEPEMPSAAAAEAERRASWKALVKHWRDELEVAMAELAVADEELGVARQNPILRETPAQREVIAQAEAKRQTALQRVEAARDMLQKKLPARAKAERVPPAWLM